MLDFTVKSFVHGYDVNFVKNVPGVVKNKIRDGDIIIIDNKVKNLYPDLLKVLNDNTNVIGLDANEKQKSYEELIPIIQEWQLK